MLRSRGLIALLDAARQAGAAGAPFNSAAALQQLVPHLTGVPVAANGLLSASTGAGSPDLCQLRGWTAPAAWRGLHTSAAAAAATAEQQAGAAGAAASPAQPEKIVLYRGKGMRLFRLLVRCGPGVGCEQRWTASPAGAVVWLAFRHAARCLLHPGLLTRVARRLKVFQLAGIAALAVPINTFLATGNVESTQVGRSGAALRCLARCHTRHIHALQA